MLRWPKGTHAVDLAQMAPRHEHHRWFLAEHGREADGHLNLLWVCPCGAYARRTITAPYLDGTEVPDTYDDLGLVNCCGVNHTDDTCKTCRNCGKGIVRS